MILVTESSQQPKLISVLEAGFTLTLAANDYNEGRRSCGNWVNFSFLTWAVMNSLNGYDLSIFSEDTSKLYICLCFMSSILPLGRWYCGWGHHPKRQCHPCPWCDGAGSQGCFCPQVEPPRSHQATDLAPPWEALLVSPEPLKPSPYSYSLLLTVGNTLAIIILNRSLWWWCWKWAVKRPTGGRGLSVDGHVLPTGDGEVLQPRWGWEM